TLSQSVEGDIVAAVPSRDVVLLTGARSTDGIEWIKRKAHEIHEGGDHVVSQTLFRRVSGEWKLSPVCDNYYYRSLIFSRTLHRKISRKLGGGARSETMRKIAPSLARVFTTVLCLAAICGYVQAQTKKIDASKAQGSQAALSCTRDAECPLDQRCGFTSGG